MIKKIRSVLMFLFVFLSTGISAQTDNLKASADAAQAWLALIDAGKYNDAWEQGSLTLKLRIPEKSWNTILEASRKPFGNPSNRQVADQRTATNPPGLPAGNYMVMIYKTDFASKKGVTEFVTLVQESDGKWRGLTYQVE